MDKSQASPCHRTLLIVFVALLMVIMPSYGGAQSSQVQESANSARLVTVEVEANPELFEMLPERIQKSRVVDVGTEARYPPYEYLAKDGGTIIGLDPALIAAITSRLGINYKMHNISFSGLIPALEAGRFDLLAAAFTDTKAREQHFDFVNYYKSSQAIVVPRNSSLDVDSLSDLCGKGVSVLEASLQKRLLRKTNKTECASNPMTILAMQDNQKAFLQLMTGRADAMLVQAEVARYVIDQRQPSPFVVATAGIAPAYKGLMFQKGAKKLRDAFQAALQSLVNDGTYMKILKELNLEGGAIDNITINAATK